MNSLLTTVVCCYNEQRNEIQEIQSPLRRSECHGQERGQANAGIARPRALFQGQQIPEGLWGWVAEGEAAQAKGREERWKTMNVEAAAVGTKAGHGARVRDTDGLHKRRGVWH